jgi:branched-subunit amino acid aminotransferase/4-amino-4-deoxychorismate lyase
LDSSSPAASERLHDTALAVFRRELEEASRPVAEKELRQKAVSFLEAAGPAGLRPLVCAEILAATGQLASASAVEYQVTLLLTCDTAGPHTPTDRGFDLYAFVQPMPSMEAMVDVQAHRADRSNPTIKDVQWVNDRQHLEEIQRAAGVNEVIMFDKDGCVTEGLQTNVFVFMADGSLMTAPDERVLAGTVRKVVLQVAERENIPVRYECPSIHGLADWESCFICSTSRMVKPIGSVEAPGLPAFRQFPAGGSGAHRVEALVKAAVLGNSEPLSG